MSQEKAHVCVLCNSKLESKQALQDHFRKHANKEIDLKGRAVGPGGQVKQTSNNGVYIKGSGSQVNTHVTCDVCGEEFTCNTKAIQHKFRKHPFNAAKHYCPQCGMQFPLQGHRDKHLKEQHESDHVPRNPYPCYQCGAVFYNKSAHEYHDKSAHHRVVTLYKQIQTPPPSKKIRYNNAGEPQSVYYCHLCGSEYIVKFNLQKHIERQHPPEERNLQPPELFKCNTCDALFYNPRAYHNHNIYHRPDDLYVTSEEQRLQTVTRVDQDFDIRRVQPAAERYIPKFRRRRAKMPPPKINLNAKKDEEEEEMSPPPNSDSDSETEPLEKKKTKLAGNASLTKSKIPSEESVEKISISSTTGNSVKRKAEDRKSRVTPANVDSSEKTADKATEKKASSPASRGGVTDLPPISAILSAPTAAPVVGSLAESDQLGLTSEQPVLQEL